MTLDLSGRVIASWVQVYQHIGESEYTITGEPGKKRLVQLSLHNNQIYSWEGFTPGSIEHLYLINNPFPIDASTFKQIRAIYTIRVYIIRKNCLRRYIARYRASKVARILKINKDSAIYRDFYEALLQYN